MPNDKRVRIKLSDGDVIEVNNVDDYIVNRNKGTLCLIIGGYRQIFNLDYVMYIMMTSCLDNA